MLAQRSHKEVKKKKYVTRINVIHWSQKEKRNGISKVFISLFT